MLLIPCCAAVASVLVLLALKNGYMAFTYGKHILRLAFFCFECFCKFVSENYNIKYNLLEKVLFLRSCAMLMKHAKQEHPVIH